ncbi:MAG: phage tail tube protein [Desulfuromonadales bacterium]|nr:phage tail tube protein [Desulfuromonadales bacterium]
MDRQATGANARLIYGITQDPWKIPEAAEGIVLYYKGGESFGATQDENASDVLRSNPNPTQGMDGANKIAGGFSSELSYQMGLLIKQHFGKCTSGAADGQGVYTEVITLSKYDDYLWFEKGFTDLEAPQYFAFTGHKIGKYSYDRKAVGPIDISFDAPGCRDLPAKGTTCDSTPVDMGHTPFNAKLGDVLVNNASIGIIASAKFDSERTANPSEPIIGSGGYSKGIPVGKGTIKGSFTALFENMELLEMAEKREVVSIKLTDQNGDGSGKLGNESMETFFPEVNISKKTPDIKDDGGVMIDCEFNAFLRDDPAGKGSACIVTIKHSNSALHNLLNPMP